MSKETIRVEVEVAADDGHAHTAYVEASDIKRVVLEALDLIEKDARRRGCGIDAAIRRAIREGAGA